MAGSSFKPNSSAFQAMAVGPEIRAIVRSIAEIAKDDAIAMSTDFVVTGDYIGSFETDTQIVSLKTAFGSHPVAAGILTNTSDHAAAVEWGNRDHPQAHRILGRVLAELGE